MRWKYDQLIFFVGHKKLPPFDVILKDQSIDTLDTKELQRDVDGSKRLAEPLESGKSRDVSQHWEQAKHKCTTTMSQVLLSYSDCREVLHRSRDTKTETVFDVEHKGASSKQNWY